MTHSSLPQRIEPISLAHKNANINGILSLSDLPRLADLLYQNEGEIEVTLTFGKDQKNFYYIKGHITTELSLKCQRCLEPIYFKINTDFNLSPIKEDKLAETLPAVYEPILLVDKTLSVSDIITDEIILNLPMVAKHDLMCAVK